MKMRIQIGAQYVNKATGKTTSVVGSYTTKVVYKGDYGDVACTPEEFRAGFDRVRKTDRARVQ